MFQTESEITVSSVNGMKYVIAALSEAMRLVPAVPVGLPRMISTKGGQMVSGHWLPENVCVRFPHRSLMYANISPYEDQMQYIK